MLAAAEAGVLQAALAGEWNTPRPLVFEPAEAPGAVRTVAGDQQLVAEIAKRDGKVQHLVTLTDSSDGFTMTGCANQQSTRVQWDNGSVWTKVVAASRLEVATNVKLLDAQKAEKPEEAYKAEGGDGDAAAAAGCCSFFRCCSSQFPAPAPPAKLGRELPVEIVRASGLRRADLTGSPDVYCTCAIQDKPGAISFRTPCVSSADPVWNHLGLLRDYCVGDSLEFTLWDKDVLKKEPLGKVVLPSGRFHPDGFEGELQVERAGEGVAPVLVVDVAPASELERRKLMLSDRQVANVVERINEHLDVPFVSESLEAQALSKLVGALNRRLRGGLMTFCDRAWVNALELLLDETLDRRAKTQEVSAVLRQSFRDPLAKALSGMINGVVDVPEFVQEKLLQVNKYLVSQFVQELIDGAVDGLEDVGLGISMEDGAESGAA